MEKDAQNYEIIYIFGKYISNTYVFFKKCILLNNYTTNTYHSKYYLLFAVIYQDDVFYLFYRFYLWRSCCTKVY